MWKSFPENIEILSTGDDSVFREAKALSISGILNIKGTAKLGIVAGIDGFEKEDAKN